MPPVIVGIAAGVAAAGVVSTAAAIAIGIGAAALTYAATPKFDGGSFANEAFSQQQMLRSPVEPRRGIYGRAMVSGPLVFAEETGTDNAYLHLVIPLAGHRCDGIEKIYFGDDVAWANGALTAKYASVARIKIHLGNQTTSDPDLTAECRQWTSAHVGFGVTYLYARLKFDTKVFPNGVPNIKALVRGKQVYDPRKTTHNWSDPVTWEWSDNWALCCLDYNRFESGVGAAAHEIDLSYFAAAANDSDQLVEYKTGKFEKRYTCNGTYNTDVSPSSIMEKMLTAGAGMHVYVSGQYRLYAGVYQGPEVLVLTEDDAAGDIDVRPYTPRAELCNAVRGTFVDPENFYQPTDFPPYESSYYRAQDDGEYIDHDLDLPFTQSVWTAQRLGKLYLEQKRAGMQISMPVKMIGVAVSVGKVVGLSLPRLGIDGTFQIVDWQFDYGKPVSLILVETSPELFDYAMGSYTERDLTPNVILPNPATVPTPVGLQYVEYQDDPQWQGELTWSAPANNSSYRYVIEVSNGLGEVVYQTNADATRLLLPKFDAGFYTVSVWALNLFANRSNAPATITIGATLPAPVTGIEVIAGPLTLTLRPTTAAAIAQTTQFEILGSITNNIADAALIGTGKDAVWPDRHPNTRYQVWARTINNYGASSWYGPVQATTSADNSSIIDLIGNTFKSYTWFAWADDNQGTGFTTVEALGDGKAYMGIATDKETASPSGNWQEYTWTKIKTEIPPVFTPEEEAKLDNLMAGKLPFAPDKDMLAAQDALNNPALANNLITALSLLNQGINAPALGGETPSGAQSKASSAQSAAIAASATDATTKANNAKAAAESYALAKANLAETTAKAYADGIVTDEEARAIADAQAKADAAKAAAIAAAAADATSKANNAKAQAEANAALDALNKANTAKADAISTAATDATTKANNAKAAAESYALAKANLAETTAKAYADGIVSDEEARAIADAQAKADAAKAAAIAAAAADANTKANNAKAQAEANAALDALNKANTAKADAISTAATDATTKANNAKTQAISSAATDATTKADAAKAAAIAAAAADATTKANNAKAQAEANAALDALNKANTAKADAISTAATDATNKVDAVKVGGVNLFENSANITIDRTTSEHGYFASIQHVIDKLENNEPITISFDVDSVYGYYIQCYNSNKAGERVFLPAAFHNFGPNKVRLSFTTKIVNNGGTINSPGNTWIEFYSNYGTGDFWKVSKLKIERGTKATDWSPAPEDHYDYADAAQDSAIAAAAADATTKANNAKAQAEANAALDALNKANTAKADAISTASTDATTKANNAKTQAISSAATDATTKSDAAKAAAIAAAAADATTKANNAKVQAEANAALDALNKANTAKADAISTAATDATTKANTAKADAISTASTDATTKANNAKTQAISSAATDATTKANNAQSAAIAAAAADATTKANNAKAQAEANAALDALNKANTAITNAKSDPELANNISTGGLTTIASPEGGSYSVNTANAVGAIKIQLPVGYISTMLSFFVDVFDYRTGYSFTVAISGYCYSTSSVWVNPTAKIIGDNITNYTVRFGDENDKCCIWIAEVNTVFNYPKIVVRDLKCGHGNYSINTWRTGWAVSLVTAFGNVKTTLTNNLVGYADSKAKADAALASAETYALAKANGAETAAINAVSIGNFIADVGLISTLFANSGLFNQLKSRLGSFGGLTAETIAALAIATNHLQAGAVTVDKVSANAITAEKIAALAIATNHLQAGAVTVDKVSANAITAEKIAALAIATNHLQAGAVTVDKVGANAITAAKIAALAIATNHLQAGAITADKVGANAITADKIAALAIATNNLQAGAVTADKVTADTALIQKLIANVGLFNQLQAQLGVFGGLAANSIAAGAITVDKLDVRAKNLVNNVSQTGVITGWSGGVVVDHTHKGKVTKALQVSSAGDAQIFSDLFDIDHTKIYEVNFTIHRVSGGATGTRYLGISADGDGIVYSVNPDTRAVGSSTSKYYFWNGGIVDGQYRQMRAYIIGSEVDPASIPESLNVASCCLLNPSTKKVRLRALNYYNNGVTTVDRWLNMSVTEIGGGQISANQLLANSALFNQLKSKIGAFGGLTANEIQADTALINKLVGTSGLFNDLVARLAVFGGLTANSIASDAILGRHIKAGEKITSPIIEGGEVRLIGTAFMKVQSATPFGPDGLVEWYGPKILVNGAPDWANIRKSNAITYLAANGDAYFGGSLSAGVLKTGVTNTDKTPYAANSYPVTIGPFGSNGKAKTVVVSFALSAHSQNPTNPTNPTQPQLSWQLQRKIDSGSWATVSSGVFNGTTSADFEAEPPAHWLVRETCWGSFTFTDNTNSTSDFNYRVLVIRYSRYHATSNVNTHNLSLISTEQ